MERGISRSAGSLPNQYGVARQWEKSGPNLQVRSDSDIFLNAAGQLDQLLPFELEREVARIGVLVRYLLDQWRIIPGLQVGPDFAGARAMQIADKLVRLRRAAYGIIEDEGRSDIVSLKNPLRFILAFDRGNTHCPARPVCLPVKFGFSIDDDHEHRRLLGRPVDHPPGSRVEHASAVAFNGLQFCRS